MRRDGKAAVLSTPGAAFSVPRVRWILLQIGIQGSAGLVVRGLHLEHAMVHSLLPTNAETTTLPRASAAISCMVTLNTKDHDMATTRQERATSAPAPRACEQERL